MNFEKIINSINQYNNQLIIDNNKKWNHSREAKRISDYLDGDLHDFFDSVSDEQLFKIVSDQFDVIFIGEVFHVISLQSLIYNLEHAYNCLSDTGTIQIAINQDSIDTMKTAQSKIISRLEKLDNFQMVSKLEYTDDSLKSWTMVTLQKLAGNAIDEDSIDNALQIGSEIADFVNKGKNINKLKAGFLKSNSKLSNDAFKQAYTSNTELLSIYLKNQIIELKPCFKREYLINLATFITENRKSLTSISDCETIKQGSFTIALNNYKSTTVVPTDKFIAEIVQIIDKIWIQSLKGKLDNKLLEQINRVEE